MELGQKTVKKQQQLPMDKQQQQQQQAHFPNNKPSNQVPRIYEINENSQINPKLPIMNLEERGRVKERHINNKERFKFSRSRTQSPFVYTANNTYANTNTNTNTNNTNHQTVYSNLAYNNKIELKRHSISSISVSNSQESTTPTTLSTTTITNNNINHLNEFANPQLNDKYDNKLLMSAYNDNNVFNTVVPQFKKNYSLNMNSNHKNATNINGDHNNNTIVSKLDTRITNDLHIPNLNKPRKTSNLTHQVMIFQQADQSISQQLANGNSKEYIKPSELKPSELKFSQSNEDKDKLINPFTQEIINTDNNTVLSSQNLKNNPLVHTHIVDKIINRSFPDSILDKSKSKTSNGLNSDSEPDMDSDSDSSSDEEEQDDDDLKDFNHENEQSSYSTTSNFDSTYDYTHNHTVMRVQAKQLALKELIHKSSTTENAWMKQFGGSVITNNHNPSSNRFSQPFSTTAATTPDTPNDDYEKFMNDYSNKKPVDSNNNCGTGGYGDGTSGGSGLNDKLKWSNVSIEQRHNYETINFNLRNLRMFNRDPITSSIIRIKSNEKEYNKDKNFNVSRKISKLLYKFDGSVTNLNNNSNNDSNTSNVSNNTDSDKLKNYTDSKTGKFKLGLGDDIAFTIWNKSSANLQAI
ncbi:unnamed protein product [[Candida] boidinii]|uniref:Unnamed protein product n=1 Tax=Candida boidinii TaxID=5477 RepID=A0A9W6WFH9_CANBO|nr:hypothetical protein B5S33_g3136 [[Candida] boidinii]GME68109.1 unnamed protein product [[Candida] boidinii]GMF98161.1 unnamed protein product [[Candida] boidinii]